MPVAVFAFVGHHGCHVRARSPVVGWRAPARPSLTSRAGVPNPRLGNLPLAVRTVAVSLPHFRAPFRISPKGPHQHVQHQTRRRDQAG
jgi:hypothetical protein